jgi:hypothetical protein
MTTDVPPDAGRAVLDVELVLMDAAAKLYGSFRDAAEAQPDARVTPETIDALRIRTADEIETGASEVALKLRNAVRDRIRERRTRDGLEWHEDACNLPTSETEVLCILAVGHVGAHLPEV